MGSLDKIRYESFGGIVSSQNPPFLAWVDKQFMKKIGYHYSPLWEKKIPYLSAPTEVHFSITEKCQNQCGGCYMDSHVDKNHNLTTKEIKIILKKLLDQGVFHVALGGGEAFERSDFHEIVHYCKEIGLVPNLTTSGYRSGSKEIAIMKLMGQVNISIDGIFDKYCINGRDGDFTTVDNSIKKLKKAGITTGINCVVSRKNFNHIEDVVAYADEHNLNEVELLKYKPTGRAAKNNYADFALTQQMLKTFYPKMEALSKKYQVELKMDCSFIPALAWHKPPIEDLEKLAVCGCDAGNMLLAIDSSGNFSGCSFVKNSESAQQLAQKWHTSTHLQKFRQLEEKLPPPCKDCTYLSICRGGCRAVALFQTGDFFAPDPECPIVATWSKNEK